MIDKKSVCFTIIGLVFFQALINFLFFYRYPYSWIATEGEIKSRIEYAETESGLSDIINSRESVLSKFSGAIGLLRTPSQRPRLIPLVFACINTLFKNELYSIFLMNTIFFSLILLGVFLIGNKLYDFKIGLFSAYLVSFYPAIYTNIRLSTLDFPLTLVFIFLFYILIEPERFLFCSEAILFGLLLGVGILIKASILIFILGPSVILLFSFFKNPWKRYKLVINFCFAIILAALISRFWFNGNERSILSNFMLYVFPDKINKLIGSPFLLFPQKTNIFSVLFDGAVLTYNAISQGASDLLLIIFIISAITAFAKNPRNRMLVFFIVLPVFLISFSSLKFERYFMPVLPLMSICTSVMIMGIEKKALKRIFVVTLCFMITVLFFLKLFRAPDYKFRIFYQQMGKEYEIVADEFLSDISNASKKTANQKLLLVSEGSTKKYDIPLLLKYGMVKKQKEYGLSLDFGVSDISHSDFILFLLDRRFLFKMALLLEEGRSACREKACYMDACDKYMVDKHFCAVMLNPEKVNGYIGYFTRGKINGEAPFEIYEKIIFLEGIKRGMLNIGRIEKKYKLAFPEVQAWSRTYNSDGIRGLVRDFTLSPHEFDSFLAGKSNVKPSLLRDTTWSIFYKTYKDLNLTLLAHGPVTSLGVDFYLFSK